MRWLGIPSISIIIPVLNEAAGIVELLEPLQHFRAQGAEIIIADGGSTDGTANLAWQLVDSIRTAPRGRGIQMNAGAEMAGGRVFLFLHADTHLPSAALGLIEQAIHDGAIWGRFDVRIKGSSRGLEMVAFMMNWRSRLTGVATGDQAIFVTREAFYRIGGFSDIPLMEDLVFSQAMRAIARPACLREKVTTSGRRWEAKGLMRTILMMWRLRWRFYFGASPNDLSREYGYAPREF